MINSIEKAFLDDLPEGLATELAEALLQYLDERGFKIVPKEPTEKMWGGLARDIVMWTRFQHARPTGETLYKHLRSIRGEPPEWLRQEIPDNNNVPPKGTVAAVIYKAMIEAA